MEEKIKEFLKVANDSNPQQAAHFIEQAKGDVDQALNQFFEGLGETQAIRPPSPPKPSSQPSSSAPSKSSSQKSSSSKSSSSGAKIASLADLHNDDSHDSDEDDGQEFFAGGKASGVALQGPSNAKKSAQDAIGKILQTAQETGKKEQQKHTENQSKRSKVFHGSGNRLGDGTEPEVISGSSSSSTNTNSSEAKKPDEESDEEQELEELQYILTFWEDGFSIDDGPLRDYKDPANEEFLKTLGMGQVPRELKARPNQRVKVMVQHKVQEKYVAPKKVLKPFQGSGNRLGSEIPGETTTFSNPSPSSTTSTSTSISTSSSSSSSPPSSSSFAPSTPTPAAAFGANSNEPLTTIQIRLADGTRLVAKFNPTQTVEDIRRFINMSRTGESQRNYVLMTTFPNKEITDNTLTLQAANLLNAVIVQRYK